MVERQFGPYQLVKQVAVGGMAEIHLAKTVGIAGFEKYVAIKMIHPNFSQDEQFIQMLIDEAKITVQLQHVNIAQTFDLGRVGDAYYITMEYVDGADLYKILRRASEQDIPTPLDIAAFVGKEMATGLDYAHRKRDVSGQPLRIVHRDVSPQNVLISHSGEVKLVDFGIAKATMRARQTAVGVIKGKYYYMSPEQAWGDPLDHRSDVFSCGIVLYEMLTGQMLYLEEDLHRLLDIVRKAQIAPPTSLRRDIPPQLERIVMNALAKRPEDRYQTAGDLATDLERFLHVYSPVFTASKVQLYFDAVLGDNAPPPPVVEVVPELPRDAGLNTQRIERERLVRARAEFTDENSVIFRVADLQPPPEDLEWGGGTESEPLTGRVANGPARVPRPANLQTIEMVDETGGHAREFHRPSELDYGTGTDDGDVEHTVISAPPGFDDDALAAASQPTALESSFEPTVMQSDFDEGPTVAHGPREHLSATAPLSSGLDADLGGYPGEEGPTRLDLRPAERKASRASVSDGVPKPRLGQASARPAHPALSASSRPPAVSELRSPRRSRRTPPAGVPAIPERESLLQAIVGKSETAPTAPLRGAGVPNSIIPVASRLEANPQPALPSSAPPIPPASSVPGAYALPQPGVPSSVPTAPVEQRGPQRAGFPLSAPVTPNPIRGFPIHDGQAAGHSAQPLSPFPQGHAPLSITNQLAALELEEIPSEFKLGRPRSARLLLVGAVGATIVALGVAVVLLLSGGDESFQSTRLRIDTLPQGATISVDGKQLESKSPVLFDAAKIGKRYLVRAELAGHEPKEREVLFRRDSSELLFLTAIPLRIVVTSRPNADVFVDSVRVGRTPHEHKYQLAPAVVELRRKGYKPHRESLRWAEGETEKVITVTLEKK